MSARVTIPVEDAESRLSTTADRPCLEVSRWAASDAARQTLETVVLVAPDLGSLRDWHLERLAEVEDAIDRDRARDVTPGECGEVVDRERAYGDDGEGTQERDELEYEVIAKESGLRFFRDPFPDFASAWTAALSTDDPGALRIQAVPDRLPGTSGREEYLSDTDGLGFHGPGGERCASDCPTHGVDADSHHTATVRRIRNEDPADVAEQDDAA